MIIIRIYGISFYFCTLYSTLFYIFYLLYYSIYSIYISIYSIYSLYYTLYSSIESLCHNSILKFSEITKKFDIHGNFIHLNTLYSSFKNYNVQILSSLPTSNVSKVENESSKVERSQLDSFRSRHPINDPLPVHGVPIKRILPATRRTFDFCRDRGVVANRTRVFCVYLHYGLGYVRASSIAITSGQHRSGRLIVVCAT